MTDIFHDMINFEYVMDLIQPNIVISSCLDPHIMEMTDFRQMSEVNVNEDIQSLPIRHLDKDVSTEWIDYFDATWKPGNTYVIDKDKKMLKLSGWAVDILSGKPAKEVVIQIGNEFIRADYGSEKQSVVEKLGSKEYLNSGLTIKLDADKVSAAGGFSSNVIGSDGSYTYEPITYSVGR